MFSLRTVASCASLFALLAGIASAQPVRPMSGALVVAQTSPAGARLIWDATTYVTDLVSEKIGGDPGIRAIEATALRALAEKSKSLSATTLTLSVTYAKTGAVSPVYGSVTFAGFEPVVTIVAKRAGLAAHAAAWSTQLANGTVPRGVTVSVTGTLPPV
jgi:Flp pilus assembly protein TadD